MFRHIHVMLIVGIAFSLFVPNVLHASHIAGGEIQYRCLGNDSVEITLYVVRDCHGVALNPTVQFQISNADGSVLTFFESGIDSTYFENPVVVLDDCNIPVNSACRQVGIYRQVVYMPPIAGGYWVFVDICCRNDEMNNIDWDVTGASNSVYYTHVPQDASIPCNNSVVSDLITMIQICQNEPLTIDFNAVDPDGDSLAYKLCNPVSNLIDDPTLPYPSFELMPFLGPTFSFENMLGSGSALDINPVTGIITATPTNLGLFGTGYCIEEYRDGVLISSTIKEFQIEVVLCVPLVATINLSPNTCSFGPTLISPLANQTGWEVEWVIINQMGQQIYTGTDEFFEFQFPNNGPYTVIMTQFPGTPCEATVTQNIVFTSVSDMGELEFPDMGCVGGSGNQQILFPSETTANPDIAAWVVQVFGPDGQTYSFNSGTQASVPVVTGDWVYVLTANYVNACVVTKKDTISYNFSDLPEAQIENDPILCNTPLIDFQANEANGWNYSWNVTNSEGTSLITSSLPSFNFQFYTPGFYNVQLVVSSQFNSCVDTTNMQLQVIQLSGSDVPILGPAPCINGMPMQSITVPDSLITEYGLQFWTWTTVPPSGPQTTYDNQVTTVIPINVDGEWGFIFTGDIGGCILEGFQFATYNPISAIPPPTIPVCAIDTVYLLPNWELDGTDNTYLWSPANLVSSTTDPNPYVFSSAALGQPISYTITNSNGCNVSGQVLLEAAQYELTITPLEEGCSLPITELVTGNGTVTDVIWSNDPDFATAFWFGPQLVIDENLFFPMYVQALINGCLVNQTLTEPVFNEFTVDLSYAVPPCDYLTTSAIVSADVSYTGNFDLVWTPAPDSIINPTTGEYLLTAGTNLITANVTAADGCTQEATVTLPELPNVDWSVDAQTPTPIVEIPQSGSLDAVITGNPSAPISYVWTPAVSVSDPNIANPTITPTQTTTYTVVAAYEGTGCAKSDTVTVVVVDNNYCIPPYVQLPNSFSPNGDGLNETFKFIDAQYISTCIINIYDRWGELVFTSGDPAFAWDGTLKGKALPSDVYNAIIEITCVDGEKSTLTRELYLIQ